MRCHATASGSKPGSLDTTDFPAAPGQGLDEKREQEQIKERVFRRHASRQQVFTQEMSLIALREPSACGCDGTSRTRGRDGGGEIRVGNVEAVVAFRWILVASKICSGWEARWEGVCGEELDEVEEVLVVRAVLTAEIV